MTHKKNKKYSKKNHKIKKNKKTKYSIKKNKKTKYNIKKNKKKQIGGNEFLKGLIKPFESDIDKIKEYIKLPLELIQKLIQELANKADSLSPEQNRQNITKIKQVLEPYTEFISNLGGKTIGRVFKQAINQSGILPVLEGSMDILKDIIKMIKDTKIMDQITPMIQRVMKIMNDIIDSIFGDSQRLVATNGNG